MTAQLSMLLHYEDGTQKTVGFALPLSIGRSHTAGLRFNSWRVARKHASIQLGPEGVYIEDFGALAGTLVNGRRIARFGPLLPGHEILIGPCRMLVQRLPGGLHPASATYDGFAGYSAEMGVGSGKALSVAEKAVAAGTDTAETETKSATRLQAGSTALPFINASHTISVSSQEQTGAVGDRAAAVSQDHRQRLHRALLDALDLRRRDIASLSDEALRAEASALLFDILEADTEIDACTNRQLLLEEVVNEAVGLGPLEPLLADPAISEIMVNRFDEIFIESAGRLSRHGSVFSSEQAVQSVIERIVSPLGRRIDESSPMVDARLPDGSRVNAVIPPIALRGASLTIRKFPEVRPGMEDLLRVGALSPAMQAFLLACVVDKKNILVSGGTGSGKTTLLNILSNAIPAGERIVTIEDAAELRLNHEHLVTLEARPANLEGRGRIEIRDLVRNALRMRPDRIVIGECRGSEAFDMLAAMNTGHEGSLTTLHANSPRDALGRLETMILMAGMDLPLAAVREHIASSIDVIVQQVRTTDGRRLVSAIVEVTGMESGRIQTQDLFLYQESPQRMFAACGAIPDLLNKGTTRTLHRLDVQLFSTSYQCVSGSSRFDMGTVLA